MSENVNISDRAADKLHKEAEGVSKMKESIDVRSVGGGG